MFEHLDPGWWPCQGTCVFFRGGTLLEEVGHRVEVGAAPGLLPGCG